MATVGHSGAADFRLRDVRGDCAVVFDGDIVGVGPVAAVGRLKADGNGNATGSRTLVLPSGAVQQTLTCTYTVNPDGTGTATCSISDGSKDGFAFVLSKRGRRADFVGTNVNMVVRGPARRQ